jgi:transcriptional accessory protein Tex/SPT6
MNKKQLKQLIKPLVQQCVNEILLEEGMLSGIIREVASGLNTSPEKQIVKESKQIQTNRDQEVNRRKILETKRKMLDAIGSDSYGGVNVFEGTEPLSSGGTPNGSPSPQSPLAGVDPRDPGVDISSLMPGMDKLWKKLI